MLVTALLTMIVIWFLFYATLPSAILIFLCIFMGGALTFMSRHKHEGVLIIDIVAQKSRLNRVNPSLKFCTILILMFLCVASNSPIIGLILTLLMLLLIVIVGGMELHDYLSFLSLPISFLLLSGIALLFEYRIQPGGVINLQVFQGYFSVSRAAQIRTTLVMSKALGSISCLYLLSLSTSMSEIIGVLRRFHIPDIVIELMYLIYRYAFILLEMYRAMKDSAKSRHGFINFSISLRTIGSIYSNLLARSFLQAYKNFDAMESRCYTGEIRFLEKSKKFSYIHIVIAVSIITLTLVVTLALY